MSLAGKILDITPKYAIAGGEIVIDCEDFSVNSDDDFGAYVNGLPARLVASSPNRIVAIVPDCSPGEALVHLESGMDESPTADITVGEKIADGMHIVANPAIDPSDESIMVTRSGRRGQRIENTIFRINSNGIVDELQDQIINPTGLAFGPDGNLYTTNRFDGEVYVLSNDTHSTFASGLGIATGIAFDTHGLMYIGDRSGTIYKVPEFGSIERFATLEPSVAAYHMAFGPDERLYVSSPGLASNDSIYAVDRTGFVEVFATGFGRPQGLAFDRSGSLYIAACYGGRRGIFRVSSTGDIEEYLIAGMNIVGLCFTRSGKTIVATADEVFKLNTHISGLLLN